MGKGVTSLGTGKSYRKEQSFSFISCKMRDQTRNLKKSGGKNNLKTVTSQHDVAHG